MFYKVIPFWILDIFRVLLKETNCSYWRGGGCFEKKGLKWNIKWFMFQNLVLKQHGNKKKCGRKQKPKVIASVTKYLNGAMSSSRLSSRCERCFIYWKLEKFHKTSFLKASRLVSKFKWGHFLGSRSVNGYKTRIRLWV